MLFFVSYEFHCSFRPNAFDFLLNEETLQWLEYGKEKLKEVETLWTVGASYTHISPKWVINPLQSYSTGCEAAMIKTGGEL